MATHGLRPGASRWRLDAASTALMICAWWDRERQRWNVLIDGQVGWTHGIRFLGGARTATRSADQQLPEGGAVLPAAWIEADGPLRVEEDGRIVVEVSHARP